MAYIEKSLKTKDNININGRDKMEEQNLPFMIATTVVVTLLIAFGLFIVISISSVTYETAPSHKVEIFRVTDPSADQNLVLSFIPSDKPTVEQYDGNSWSTVESKYVDWTTGTTMLKVSASGLVGG